MMIFTELHIARVAVPNQIVQEPATVEQSLMLNVLIAVRVGADARI